MAVFVRRIDFFGSDRRRHRRRRRGLVSQRGERGVEIRVRRPRVGAARRHFGNRLDRDGLCFELDKRRSEGVHACS